MLYASLVYSYSCVYIHSRWILANVEVCLFEVCLNIGLVIWYVFSKDYGGFMAETFTRAGCIVVGMGYPIAPGNI